MQFQTGTVWVRTFPAVPEVCTLDTPSLLTDTVEAVEAAGLDGAVAERKADSMKRDTSAFLPRCLAGELMNSSSRARVTAT
ncbi:hypothetical protein D3C80_1662500 [compost metagenome]